MNLGFELLLFTGERGYNLDNVVLTTVGKRCWVKYEIKQAGSGSQRGYSECGFEFAKGGLGS